MILRYSIWYDMIDMKWYNEMMYDKITIWYVIILMPLMPPSQWINANTNCAKGTWRHHVSLDGLLDEGEAGNGAGSCQKSWVGKAGKILEIGRQTNQVMMRCKINKWHNYKKQITTFNTDCPPHRNSLRQHHHCHCFGSERQPAKWKWSQ